MVHQCHFNWFPVVCKERNLYGSVQGCEELELTVFIMSDGRLQPGQIAIVTETKRQSYALSFAPTGNLMSPTEVILLVDKTEAQRTRGKNKMHKKNM